VYKTGGNITAKNIHTIRNYAIADVNINLVRPQKLYLILL